MARRSSSDIRIDYVCNQERECIDDEEDNLAANQLVDVLGSKHRSMKLL